MSDTAGYAFAAFFAWIGFLCLWLAYFLHSDRRKSKARIAALRSREER